MSIAPTRHDLSGRLQGFYARERPRLIIAIIVFAAVMVGIRQMGPWLTAHGAAPGTELLILGAAIGGMGGYLWDGRRRAREAGLACSNCSRPFTHPGAIRSVLTSGRCKWCDAAVASDTEAVPGDDTARSYSDVRHRVDAAKRAALVAQVQAMSVERDALPLVSAKQFFHGNGDSSSLATNALTHPGIVRFAELVREIEARPEVQMVLVGITDLMADDPDSWPYSDTLYVVTSEWPDVVREWFAEVAPDEVNKWSWSSAELSAGAPPVAPGMTPVRVWWD